MPVKASIVIRTLNEAKHLGRLFEGINEQNYSDWEVILVDSGSTDGTLDIAQQYGANIHHIPKDQFTYGRSLNLGCEQAQGQYLVFASGHVWPVTNNWLGNLIKPFDDPTVAMVYGRQQGTDGSRLSELRDLSITFGRASTVLVDEAKGNNGNGAIRRDLWLNQPFDESLPGLEDVDWAHKAERNNHHIYYAADAAVYHFHDESLRQVYRRYLREAIAAKRMFPYYRFTKSDLAKGLPYFILRDILYAFRERKKRKVIHVPGTRIAQFLGNYHGVRYHKSLAGQVMDRVKIPQSYQAVVVDGPKVHSLQQRDVPEVEPDQVLVQVAYTGVNPADLDMANGCLDHLHGESVRYPAVPGHEFAGLVVQTGPKVQQLSKGQKVAGFSVVGCGRCALCAAGQHGLCQTQGRQDAAGPDGAYAQYVLRYASHLRKLPWDIPLSYGALAGTLALCISGIGRLETRPQGRAYVVGAGPVGNLCAQILGSRGLRVAAVDSNRRWLSFLHKYDMDTFTELGPLDRYDYVVETTGKPGALAGLTENSKPSAQVLSLSHLGAVSGGDGSAAVPDAGKLVYGPSSSSASDWDQAIKLVAKGVIRLDDHTNAVEPLESYLKAWSSVADGDTFKVLLRVNKDLEAL